MFETPEERVKLLKAGIDGKTIEELYISNNNFKIVSFPMHFEFVENNIESKGLTSEFDENNFVKQNSFTDFPHLFERISMVGIPQFIQGFRIFPS
jgi:hypothetical protein